MNDEAKVTITHTDLCQAVGLWMKTEVFKFDVDVSAVEKETAYSEKFVVTFKRNTA